MNPGIKRFLSMLLALTMVFSLITPASASAATNGPIEIEVGQSVKLNLNGFFTKTSWSSSDNGIATVSNNGTVTGVAPGDVTITADCWFLFGFWSRNEKTEYKIKVKAPEAEPVTVEEGKTLQLSVNAAGGKVTWQTADAAVATVNKNGVVTGVAPGVAIVTAKITRFYGFFGSKTELVCFEVTVTEAPEVPEEPETPPVVDPDALTVKEGETLQLTVDAKGGKVTWSSSDEAVATVNKNGLVTGVSEGTVTIQAKIQKTIYNWFFWWAPPQTKTTVEAFEVTVLPAINYYTVTFETNGGSAVEEQTIEEGMTATRPEDPTLEGFNFAGWYVDEELTEEYDFAAPVTSDITLYAAWYSSVLKHTVSFETNGGNNIESVQVEDGTLLPVPEVPVKDGHLFTGWYTSDTLDVHFSFEDTIITDDITLYAGWIEVDEDDLAVDRAVNMLVIEYQQGDNADHVTKNVGLPTVVEGAEDVTITWSSSSSLIASNGVVTRPSGSDARVTLTATAVKNSAQASITFTLNVIHLHDRNPSDVPNLSVVDLENMNIDDDLFDLSYNSDRTQITSIDGKFSEIPVENADDALDVAASIHTILGLEDPYNELETLIVSGTEYGKSYTFQQTYQGIPVYARRITVCADSSGTANSMSSGLCPTYILDGAAHSASISAFDAESIAASEYGGTCQAVSEETELAYYALNEYQDAPVLAYVVIISGTDINGEYVEERVFVNSRTGDIFRTETLLIEATAMTGSGRNELGATVSFPVSYKAIAINHYTMEDLDRDIQAYTGSVFDEIDHSENSWTDATAVSAYTNVIKTYDWFKNSLGRDSLNDNGKKIKVIVHNTSMTDNAFWSGSNKTLNFCDNSAGSSRTTTTAAGLDIVAHEYTHGIVQYETGGLPYENATGAINEGYADIFGCLVEGDWEVGEDWQTLRDVSSPLSYGQPDKMSSSRYYQPVSNPNDNNDRGGVHRNNTLVSYPAYLMEEYGMSRRVLVELWYNSLRKGYDGTSTYQTVRKNVIKAAREMRLSHNQIDIIQQAFNEVEIWGDRGTLNVRVMDTSGNVISGAVVAVAERGICLNPGTNNLYTGTLDEGTYTIDVTADGYVSYQASVEIEDAETTTLNVTLVSAGEGTASGTVVSATSALTLGNVALKVRAGMNMKVGEVIASGTTNSNGSYSFTLDAGYYTIEMALDGYTTGYINTIIEGGQTVTANGSLSPIMDSNTYRVVLTWGASPSDLDSHLTGRAADGSNFHIYFGDKEANKNNGTEIGNLDVDDVTSYGPETTTFVAETTGSYYFYVYRYSSNGSLPASGATVEVYNGNRLIADYKIDSSASSSLRYWNVFKIENGIFVPVDTVSSSAAVSSVSTFAFRSPTADQDNEEKIPVEENEVPDETIPETTEETVPEETVEDVTDTTEPTEETIPEETKPVEEDVKVTEPTEEAEVTEATEPVEVPVIEEDEKVTEEELTVAELTPEETIAEETIALIPEETEVLSEDGEAEAETP